jgi:fumarylacetoacetate (FAA) hydrolase
MKLASLKSNIKGNRHGNLIVVSKDLKLGVRPLNIPNLLEALQNWNQIKTTLEELYERINHGKCNDAFDLNLSLCLAPLPHCFGLFDGSAFLSHVVRARKARGDNMPESAKVTPLMYQGVSDNHLPWNSDLEIMDMSYGGDFEGEIAAITTDVPRGTKSEKTPEHIALFTLFNDVTYREIVKTELETKFGFLQSKPNSSFAPIVVTPDEFGSLWDGKRIHAEMLVKFNNQPYGHPKGNEMHFTFGDLIAHACRTRPLSAGTIVGTGTFSNEDANRGFACLTEKRFQEVLDNGKVSTPWLKPGDRVCIEMKDQAGQSIFGMIEQKVVL